MKSSLYFHFFFTYTSREVLMKHLIQPIAVALNIQESQVVNTLKLLEEGNTVPFIARYRKEMTKGLDEEQIRLINEQYEYQSNLEKRKEDVARLIETQGKLTDEIRASIEACVKLSQVEDIYRPYQQKRKTRARDAISKGLMPLAEYILSLPTYGSIEEQAKQYLSEQVFTSEEAILGASDIIAEKISDDIQIRNKLSDSMAHYGYMVCKARKNHNDEKKVYRMYYDFKTRVSSLANHNIMAIDRAEKEKIISVTIEFDKAYCIQFAINKLTKKRSTIAQSLIEAAVNDGLSRLAIPSVENQLRNELTEKAQLASMDVFSMNLERLLLQPPLKDKTILGFDPAFRTGCKLAVIDASGKMLTVSVIYPHPPNAKVNEAKQEMLRLIQSYQVQVIAIGNGTASRESESFVASLIKEYQLSVSFVMVSEAGASVYSASSLAREEFPDLHVEQRSAISIARRLMDPLAELIKIDPQSIGVGQYQHDLASKSLKERLSFVVEKAVNRVGVNINTASVELLKNISGLSAVVAKNIVLYREENRGIKSRNELLSIPKVGQKAFQQAAGFLRIEEGTELLDRTGIHPESYQATYSVIKALGCKNEDIASDKIREAIKQADLEQIALSCQIDSYTLQDICEALKEPLRDYRDSYDSVILRQDILELEDLQMNEKLQGTIRNVVDFGAFVDIGLHEDGLVHVSNMSKSRFSHPSEIVSVGDIVDVWVKKIDQEKEKVQLSLIEP